MRQLGRAAGLAQKCRNRASSDLLAGYDLALPDCGMSLELYPKRTSLSGAPQAAVRARSALRIQDAFVSPRNSAQTVIAGQLASVEPPHTGPITIACVDGEVFSVHCSQVEHFATLLSETPNFGLLVPKLDVELTALSWLWQD